ncbi:MAG: helix-turn-helix transcriptional regulator [Lachnospiraceae bacterium]|nr:helix-turn-helix transcriptional regulator [Lachnospiraceae bacterium]
MKLSLGTKIRELRRRDGRTQEALADALGVTSQAVSFWETDRSYPDIEMIPAIANYFHVAIDELFGYNNDREVKINAIIETADKAIRSIGNHLAKGNGDLSECVEMLREAIEEFPNEPKLLLRLAYALYVLGWQKNGARLSSDTSEYLSEDVEYNAQNIYWQESLQIYEKLLNMDIQAEREGVIFMLVTLYKRIGNYEKAKELANKQPSLVRSKEILLTLATVGEELAKYQGESIIALLQELGSAITSAISDKPALAASEYARTVLLSLAQLYETVFNDGRYGNKHLSIKYLYLKLANYEAQYGSDISKAVTYFDKALEHHQEYCYICDTEEYNYSAPLITGVTVSRDRFTPVPSNFWKMQMEYMPDKLCDELRKIDKYTECFK